jgi:hypothetical protein
MKIKQKNQILISGVYALLISVVFLLAPSLLKAQTEFKDGQDNVVGTSDSRMVVTIAETAGYVKLDVAMLGVIQANGFGFTLLYEPSALTLTDNTLSADVLPPNIGNIFQNVVTIVPDLVNLGFSWNANNQQPVTGGGALGMISLRTSVATSGAISFLSLPAHQAKQIYTIYFKKNTPGVDLNISDLGFFSQANIPRIFSRWTYGSTAVTYAEGSLSDNYFVHPELFTYRSASYSEVDSISDINRAAASANIHGTFYRNRSNFPPSGSLIVSNTSGSSVSNTGLLENDTILYHGFIYSAESAEIITVDFSDLLSIDGEKYFPTASEIAAGSFIFGGKTFYIIQKSTTSTDESFTDHSLLVGLLADTDYYAWSFVRYSFSGSNTYISVGDMFEFRTGECQPVSVPATVDQSFCSTATVADLFAGIAAGNTVRWYDSPTSLFPMSSTDELADGATYYVSTVTPEGCESDRVPARVTLNAGLSSPIAETPQRFCAPATAGLLQATGVGIQWYESETSVAPMLSTDELQDGVIYYAVQSTADCTSSVRTAVKVFIGNFIPEMLAILSPQSLCGTPGLEDIATGGGAIVWYDAQINGNQLPLTTSLVNGETYYAARTAGNGCESARTPVVIEIGTTLPDAPDVTSPQIFCPGAVLSSIAIPNNQIVWYASDTEDTILPAETILTDGVTYYAAQNAGGCQSAIRTEVLIEISSTSAGAPVVPSVQPPLCEGSTLSNLTITGTLIIWYATQDGTDRLPVTTPLENGVVYWAAQSAGTCQSERAAVEANINIPDIPVITVTPQVLCNHAIISDLRAGISAGSYLRWYASADAADADSIPGMTGLIDGSTYYARTLFGECLSASSTGVTVILAGDLNAPVATSPQTFCSGGAVSNLEATGTGIQWYRTPTSTVPMLSTDPLEDGAIYFASQSIGSCESPERTAVRVVIDDESLIPSPAIAPSQSLCSPAVLADVAIPADIVNNVVWYASETSTDPLDPLSTGINTGSSFYAALRLGDCESAVRTKVDITLVQAVGRPEVTSPQTFCEGTTLASVTVPNNQIVWYATATGDVALDPATVLLSGVYYAAQQAGACQTAVSDRQAVTINIGSRASAPIADPVQSFYCRGVIANLQVTGSNVVWYDAPTGGTALSLTTPLVNGRIYYATQGTGSCQSETRTAVTAMIITLEAPVAQARQLFCNFAGATVADLQARGEGILWYASATATQPLPLNTPLVAGQTYYAAQTVGDCASATRTAVIAGEGVEIVQKDNHILVINNNFATNGGFDFTYYIWYKNGLKVKEGSHGAGKGGYYIEGDLNGVTLDPSAEYLVELTEQGGSVYHTCVATIVIVPSKGSISVYPNPVVSSRVVYVDANVEESALESAHIEIYSPLGSYLGRVKAQRVTPVHLPEEKGVYVLKFISLKTEEYFKIIVK